MVITNITPCIKVRKEGNIDGYDMYFELGDQVKITKTNRQEAIGMVLSWKSEEDDNKVYLLLRSGKRYVINVSDIEDIEKIK